MARQPLARDGKPSRASIFSMSRRRNFSIRKANVPQGTPPLKSFSSVFHKISSTIDAGSYPDALGALNQLISEGLDSASTAQLLALVADVSFAQGMYSQASGIYEKAIEFTNPGPGWLRPRLAQVLCFLRQGLTNEAKATADGIITSASRTLSDFNTALQTVAAGGGDAVPERPDSVNKVRNRLARLFFQEGEQGFAHDWWQDSVDSDPARTVSAHIGLGEIALRAGDPSAAAQHLTIAIRTGNFHARTLSAWPLLLRANNLLSQPGLDPSLLSGLQQASPGVRARARLIIMQNMRSQSINSWNDMASSCLSEYQNSQPIVGCEIAKLILSSARLFGNPTNRSNAAQVLLNLHTLRYEEFLMAAKELILSDVTFDCKILVQKCLDAYGVSKLPSFQHSLSLLYKDARDYVSARTLLADSISASVSTSAQWGKSIWALARLEAEAGNPATSAALYLEYTNNSAMKPQYRLLAQLEWVSSLTESRDAQALSQASAKILNITAGLTDYNALLNFARRIYGVAPQLQRLANTIYQRGLLLANAAYQATPIYLAAGILFRVARCESFLYLESKTVAFWSDLSAATKASLDTTSSDFWNYLSVVMLSYCRIGDQQSVDDLAEFYLNDAKFPAEGVAKLRAIYGANQIRLGNITSGVVQLKQVAQNFPSLRESAYAFYWLALKAWASGDTNDASTQAEHLRLCVGTRPGTRSDYFLMICAYAIQRGISLDANDYADLPLKGEECVQAAQMILDDLKRIT